MNFNALAPHYRWIEWLFAAGQLQRCRTALLSALEAPSDVLIYGEGNGRFLESFCRRYPKANITVVDASDVMLDLSRKRALKAGLNLQQIQFVLADALLWTPPSGHFDLVVTHFFLDCFTPKQLQVLIPAIASSCRKSATWLLGDFHQKKEGWRGLPSRLLLRGLYAFFRAVTDLPADRLTPPDALLSMQGFTLERRQNLAFGLLHSDVWVRSATSTTHQG